MARHRRGKHPLVESLREIIFGIQDGAIGNLGVVVGLAQAGSPTNTVILGGLATMFAQAISMSTGTYLSVKSEKKYFLSKGWSFGRSYAKHKDPLFSALVMSVAVVIGTVVPLIPFFLGYESQMGVRSVIILTLAFLFIVGAIKARYTKEVWIKSGLEMLVIGAVAATVGFWIGSVFGV